MKVVVVANDADVGREIAVARRSGQPRVIARAVAIFVEKEEPSLVIVAKRIHENGWIEALCLVQDYALLFGEPRHVSGFAETEVVRCEALALHYSSALGKKLDSGTTNGQNGR